MTTNALYASIALIWGFVAYGLSIYLYIMAQKNFGAAWTSAFYAFDPFIGVGLSFAVFRETPTISFVVALAVMMIGAYLAAFEKHEHEPAHEVLEDEHRHSHSDGHHEHIHESAIHGEHSPSHIHAAKKHSHGHSPDLHHAHSH